MLFHQKKKGNRCFIDCDKLNYIRDELFSLKKSNRENELFIECFKNAFMYGRMPYTIIEREREKIIVSVDERHNSYGQLTDSDFYLYSADFSGTNELAKLYVRYVYNSEYNFIDNAFVTDIIASPAFNGYGSILMKEFISYIKDMSISKVCGELSFVDKDHWGLLYHFYEKFGFEIDKENQTICLDLSEFYK